MSEIAIAKINRFAPEQANVQPSEEPIFVLTSSQLLQVITRAIKPLQDEVKSLKATVATQEEKIRALESLQESETNRLCQDIAFDRKRISKLEHPERKPGQIELSRAEKIAKYLEARPDHKATFETLKGHLGIGNDLLNKSIKTLIKFYPGKYGIVHAPGDKRKRTIMLLPK
jgi:predicted RNase H-like nuclease (RuvC/YqgF family)